MIANVRMLMILYSDKGNKECQYANLPIFTLQFPGQITVSDSPFSNVLPVEIVGWLMRSREEGRSRPWLLLITDDTTCQLALQLLCRSPFPPVCFVKGRGIG